MPKTPAAKPSAIDEHIRVIVRDELAAGGGNHKVAARAVFEGLRALLAAADKSVDDEPAKAAGGKRRSACAKCHQPGHNAKTCPK